MEGLRAVAPVGDLLRPNSVQSRANPASTQWRQHSGVNTVTLSYRIDGGSWVNTAMTKTTADIYEATIPGHSAETEVEYQIAANDVAGHQAAEDNAGSYYVYTVIPEFPSLLILPLLMIATLAVIVYRRKLVASKRKHSL